MKLIHRLFTPDSGRQAEDLACRYLQQKGLKLVAKNWRCRSGEIDLILDHKDTLVFVEVRYRRSQSRGGAAASVDTPKQRRLIKTASLYLQKYSHRQTQPCRFDVITLSGNLQDNPPIEWITDAFQCH